ncbi:MAG: DUF2281 domain-containing protein [Flavobacteriales bacterium]|jgi:hypothetical protein|nr:DUF2281 domain-containing protein [Flavobacteriales bacterium]
MSSADLFVKFNSLPEGLRKKVLAYIEALLAGQPIPEQEPKKRIAGLMKGKIWIADDFDAPLDDFKEYME